MENSAGVLFWRKNHYSIEFLLVHPSSDIYNNYHAKWSIPKGNLDEGETPGDAAKREVTEENTKEVKAEYDDSKEFVMDPKGYFLIKTNKESKEIEVAFCPKPNKISLKVIGTTPLEIYQTIINKENLSLRSDHYAYLGRELQKAYTALLLDIEYVQDDELKV